ncbi:hypothetical protein PoB_006602900 [Plakobranchus ocellatus]|uniref:Uncharacterized protein n=1 Tax=Plakobranchus ocellatus TaxID=259542 RepID=A0AAV4D5V5_9GAST|nr:hypothetical protein PoB_006602900 [Plakobranchus ocellatus]
MFYIANPQQGDLRLSGPLSRQSAGGGARTRDRRVPADLRADSLVTAPPTPPYSRQSDVAGSSNASPSSNSTTLTLSTDAVGLGRKGEEVTNGAILHSVCVTGVFLSSPGSVSPHQQAGLKTFADGMSRRDLALIFLASPTGQTRESYVRLLTSGVMKKKCLEHQAQITGLSGEDLRDKKEATNQRHSSQVAPGWVSHQVT